MEANGHLVELDLFIFDSMSLHLGFCPLLEDCLAPSIIIEGSIRELKEPAIVLPFAIPWCRILW